MQNDNVIGIHRHYQESLHCFEHPKKSVLKSSHPKKYLPNFPSQKNPGIENFKPKKILQSSPSLEIRSTPPPPPPGLLVGSYRGYVIHFTVESTPGGRGGGGSTRKNLIRGGCAPRSDPLPFYIPFLAEKVPLSYTFHWKIMKGPFKYLNGRFPYPFIYFDS